LSTQEGWQRTDGNLPQAVGSLLTFVYHCFDRMVIQGYLPLLTREEHIVRLLDEA